jgi:hypothetical protein
MAIGIKTLQHRKFLGYLFGAIGTGLAIAPGVRGMEAVSPGSRTVEPAMSQVTSVSELRNAASGARPVESAMSQVTNVSELRDVAPDTWAYEALRSLVERYGCIVGYPDRTFRGDRALTRWEFAAGLNACMNAIERLLQENVAVLKEDIDKLKRLAEEFKVELAALDARVGNLESRVAFLEDRQFSTVTKLSGDIIFALGNAFGSDRAVPSGAEQTDENIDRQTFLSDRIRVKFNTSFTGTDNLHILLQANNTPVLGTNRTGTNMTRLGFDGEDNNNVFLDELWYENQITDKLWFIVGTSDLDLDDGIFYSGPSFLEPSATGAVSRFHRRNALTNRSLGGSGGAVRYKFNDLFALTSIYLVPDSTGNSPSAGEGFFNGSFVTGAQLHITPADRLDIAFTYLYEYSTADRVNLTNSTGSAIASKPFGDTPTSSNRVGATVNWRASDLINFTVWGAWGNATALGGDRRNDNATLWTWQATLGFIDVGKEGAVAFIGVGAPPYAPQVDGGQADLDMPLSILAQYNYPVSDRIQISPAVYFTINPDANAANNMTTVGLIRTTFKF